MNTAYKCDYYYYHGNSSSIHKLDSLCAFSDAIYTCDPDAGFKHFQLLTPNIMRVVITSNTLNMTTKIIPGTFSGREMTLVMRLRRGIVLFSPGKPLGRMKQAHTPQHIVCYDHHKAYVMHGARLVLTQHKY